MRLDEDGNAYKVDFVSIHASVKDATLWDYCIPFEGNVSIHASVKDATRFDVNVRYDALFQSTHL